MTIKELRERAELSQQGLADMCRLSRAMISHLENGEKAPSVETISALATALDVEPGVIMKALGDQSPPVTGSLPPVRDGEEGQGDEQQRCVHPRGPGPDQVPPGYVETS